MKMFCITVNNNHYDKIRNFDYTPVGLGNNINSKKFISDNTGENISEKNPFYGEYTFHYWLWKNHINNLKNEWIGFCQYRKYWSKENEIKSIKNLKDLNNQILKYIPNKYEHFDSILGEPLFINEFKFAKFIKKNFFKIVKQPFLLFDNKKRNIKFHFDLMHGEGNLDKAISLLEREDRSDFDDFVKKEVSFNPHNMFICKSNKILNDYYNSIFPWLKRCEKIFGFELEGYGLKRIYGFLAERYMSYWFRKYTKSSTMPIIFQDISDLD
jgi:hypothetical protein